MKILHIVPAYFPAIRYGGPIKSVHELNKWLVKNGADVTVYTTNIDGLDNLDVPLGEAVDIDGVKVFYFKSSFPRAWFYSRNLHRALEKNIKNFDLIHITSVFLSTSTLGAYYSKKFKKPYIISPRGSFMEEPLRRHSFKKKVCISLIEKRNLAGASAIHFTIEKEKNDYLKLVLPLKKDIIIPNSIDMEEFNTIARDNAEFRKKFKIATDKKIILFMGRLHKIKGLDTLIPAFAEVLKKEPKAVLIIAGGDDEGYKKEVLKIINMVNKRTSKFNLRTSQVLRTCDVPNIIFTGMLSGIDKIAAYSESDVFVMPSYSESFGMAVAEAMHFGLPVVITESVGISKEVERAGAGMVIDKNKDQLAEAILKILNNPDLAEKMGEAGRKLIKTEFSSEKIAEEFLKEYNQILQEYEKQ